jgi:hypothetical protein
VLSGGSEALVEVNYVSLTHSSEILAYYPPRAPGFLSLHLSNTGDLPRSARAIETG